MVKSNFISISMATIGVIIMLTIAGMRNKLTEGDIPSYVPFPIPDL